MSGRERGPGKRGLGERGPAEARAAVSRTDLMKVAECLGQPHASDLIRSQWPFGHTRPGGKLL